MQQPESPLSARPVVPRSAGLNIIRGYLILGVALFHLWDDIRYLDYRPGWYYSRIGERAADGEWSRLPTSVLDALLSGGYLIPSFMMLSGLALFLAAEARGGGGPWLSYWRRRMWQLYKPYFFGVALVAAAIIAIALVATALHGSNLNDELHQVTQSRFDIVLQGRWAYLASITVLPRLLVPEYRMVPPGVLWFVLLTSQYYLVFPALYLALKRLRPATFLAIAFVTTVAAKGILIATVGSFDADPSFHINHVYIPFRWFEFALGMSLGYGLVHHRGRILEMVQPGWRTAVAVVGGISGAILFNVLDASSYTYASAFADPVIIAFMAAAYLPLLVKDAGRLEAVVLVRFFAFCAPLSYAILIVSEPLRLVASFLRVEDVPTLLWWAFLVAYMPLTVAFAIPVGRLLGMTPKRAAAVPAPSPSAGSPPFATARQLPDGKIAQAESVRA